MKNKTTNSDRVTHKIASNKVKTGDLMAFVYYSKILTTDSQGDFLKVLNLDDNMEIEVHGRELVERGFSADQYAEEIKISKTKAAEILISSHNRPFTVCFEKQDGEERVLRGRLVSPEPLLGRSMCEDLDIADKNRLRLVDHRTIKYIIVEGVRYIVK